MRKILLLLLCGCAAKNVEVEKKSEEKNPVFELEEIDLEGLPEAGDNDEDEDTP